MSEGKKSSTAKTVNVEKCKEEFKVTNQFKRMMVKALKAQMIILEKRAEILKLNNWGAKEQQEFLTYSAYDTVITIDSKEEKDKARSEDPNTHRDPYIEKKKISQLISL